MVKQWFKSGSPWIWMTGGAVSISLISVLGLLAMIAWKGLSFFWPSEVVQFELEGSISKQTIITYGKIELNKDYTLKDINQVFRNLYQTDFFETLKSPYISLMLLKY